MKKIRQLTVLIFLMQMMAAGEEFSLKQCINWALVNSSNIKIGYYEEKIAHKKINEQIGAALPQISASGSVDDNLKIATQLMPSALFGNPGTFVPVQMGTKYSMSAGVQVEQKICDAAFWTGLKAAKISKGQSSLSLQKTKEQTVYLVCRAYYQTQIVKKQCQLLNAIGDAVKETLNATELKYSNGLVKKIDVDKIRISYSNSVSMAEQACLNYKQSLNNLKYQMGMSIDTQLILDTDTIFTIEFNTHEQTAVHNPCFDKRTDYQLLKISLSLQQASRNRNVAAILPTLSFNAKYNYQSMPNDFTLNDDWYNSSSIGLRLSLPIFDGLQNRSRLLQSEYAIDIAKQNIVTAEQSIKIEVSNYEMQYRNALDNIANEKANLQLAEDVYKQTQSSFQQGAASSLELIQSESSWREAQNNYFSKLLNLYFARFDLEQAKGTLKNFVETIKK